MGVWHEVGVFVLVFLTIIAAVYVTVWIAESNTPCSNLEPDRD
jgi:hypothetical protein